MVQTSVPCSAAQRAAQTVASWARYWVESKAARTDGLTMEPQKVRLTAARRDPWRVEQTAAWRASHSAESSVVTRVAKWVRLSEWTASTWDLQMVAMTAQQMAVW